MDFIPTASVLQSLDDHLAKELIKAAQPPTDDQVMGGTLSPQQTSPSPATSSSSRASFSSVREVDDDIAQAFSSTKVSSYFREAVDTAVVDDSNNSPPPSAGLDMAETQFMPPVTQPHSRLHGCWFPAVAADNFQGWKQIGVKGKQASRSYGDLQALRMVWSPAPSPKKPKNLVPAAVAVQRRPGDSPLERLPTEIKNQIIDHLVLDVPPDGLASRNADLMAMLLTSRTLHSATLNALYRNITVPHSRIFRKFLTHLAQNQQLGTIVRRLDFSHFNPTSLFSTASERAITRNLTHETLLQCLELTPYLREFLAQEYVDEDIDVHVLRKLFFGLDRLQGLDLCACSSAGFKAAFESILSDKWPQMLCITRLSLHRCINLPPAVFETILPRLTNLTHLDVAGTRITDDALKCIPRTARITHLNLAKCKLLTSTAVIDFLTNHPAVKNLVFLSLAADFRSYELLDEDDVSRLIPILPSTLRSLSLKGSKMNASHISQLRPLTKHLEELAMGRRLKTEDINRLFIPDEDIEQLDWIPHTLKYLDLSDYIAGALNLSALFSNASLLNRHSAPLEVVELPEDTNTRLSHSPAITRAGWTATEFGSRFWLVRRPEGTRDLGFRSWKMGAAFWGMRKVPVAVSDVGGMYGSYMYKRHL
ncbi:putative leucine rich repeat domain-containing protein [Rosellinia necatrix]|uniref:Putative leucine rich repeat domain-containing protein n=1 Tax=Rosellinia necatrix TaxID=77044 RepID=A0A1W2TCK2_ROSNE|nr:putative leucine rich repeat domain-containing protein [Rosellinia necatrix]